MLIARSLNQKNFKEIVEHLHTGLIIAYKHYFLCKLNDTFKIGII